MPPSTVLRYSLCAVLAAIGLQTIAILVLNSGHLVFTIDDAYIHLALAENLLRGHYGVNLTEFSAPASSILWPFLIAPVSGLPIADYCLLVFNAACALGTVCVLWRVLVSPGPGASPGGLPPRTLSLWMAVLVLACNLIGLVFLGMEHSLQVLLTSLIVLGLVQETQTRTAPWWLVAVLVAAPVIRYENAFLAGPAIVYLFLRSHRTKAVVAAVLAALPVLAFGAFLSSHQSGFLPTSVVAKSGFRGLRGIVALLGETLKTNLDSSQGVLLACGIPILAVAALARGRDAGERLFAAVVATGIAAHLLSGKTGGFGRYESYIWGALVLAIAHLYKGPLGRFTQSLGAWRSAAVAGLGLAATCLPYTAIAVLTPLASNNIYEQQYQMHRFAADYLKAVVAVNDLGLVSYRNPRYVLDLAGLASKEAFATRWQSGNDGWMQQLAGRYDAKVAMIYDDWFRSIPREWVRVAELRLGKPRIATSRSVVGIYVIAPGETGRVRGLLAEFAKTLPADVTLVSAPN